MKHEEIIVHKLIELGFAYESLTKKDKDYLEQIEEAILEVIAREEEARRLLTNNHLSINNISDKTGIARQTIYNREILLRYINLSKTKFSTNDLSRERSMKYEEVSRLKSEIELLRLRDCVIEDLKIENANLQRILKDKEEEISRLRQSITYSKQSTN